MSFSVAALPYPHDALSKKGLSEQQVTFHYEKHHKGYAVKLNAAAKENASLAKKSLQEIIQTTKGPAFNSAAQIYNHNFYWKSISPSGGGLPRGNLRHALEQSFGTYEKFREAFTAAANGHFGSGWAWLVLDAKTGRLKVYQTHDAGCPLTEENLKPILCCDVWEHAYYIDYKNDRAAYVEAWWGMVNWKHAEQRLAETGRHFVNSDL
ncbi:superoxide dismutase, Fe-Mn family [Strigomonas culicis]|uniref:Superoxide dismutase n=1 Tax=Strigomonas culicis TaxID=28005 RepID=S9U0U0_9TRYP|nr:superoxide dismutase, Fe-Mn family [Strigomonas culicis]|eukprot:EPY24387.1 superoxide dismutase, Fe-Mn family [Strigomonas culicis]